MRAFVLAAALLMALVVAPMAQDEGAPWQAVISRQIEAFRAGDGDTALGYAGQGFRTQFEGKPEAFYAAISNSGYQAIVESRSHSFGEFNRVSDTTVLQVVEFVGPDQGLYEALYQLADEEGEGWRVQGVALKRGTGIGI